MKYYIFSNTDIIGPFKAEELLSKSDFLPTTLVCPEDKVGTEEKWKMAIDYPDFKSLENISEEEITERLEHSLRHKLEDSQSTKTKNTENIENTEDKLVAENFQHIEKNMEKKYNKETISENLKDKNLAKKSTRIKHPTTFKLAKEKHSKNFFSYIVMPLSASILLILGIYVYSQYFSKKPPVQPKAKVIVMEETKIVAEPVANANVSEEIKEVVSSYYLDTKRGTVGEWFKQIFTENIKQGYVENWLVEHLYENTYVVQYRLTKPRKEPIVYIFEVDYKDKTITSALNNATMDLLAGI